MNDSDFLYVLHHFLFLLKVGQQGFPALRRFLSSQHLVFVMPLKREETLCALVYIQHMGSQVKTACTFFYHYARKPKTAINLCSAARDSTLAETEKQTELKI